MARISIADVEAFYEEVKEGRSGDLEGRVTATLSRLYDPQVNELLEKVRPIGLPSHDIKTDLRHVIDLKVRCHSSQDGYYFSADLRSGNLEETTTPQHYTDAKKAAFGISSNGFAMAPFRATPAPYNITSIFHVPSESEKPRKAKKEKYTVLKQSIRPSILAPAQVELYEKLYGPSDITRIEPHFPHTDIYDFKGHLADFMTVVGKALDLAGALFFQDIEYDNGVFLAPEESEFRTHLKEGIVENGTEYDITQDDVKGTVFFHHKKKEPVNSYRNIIVIGAGTNGSEIVERLATDEDMSIRRIYIANRTVAKAEREANKAEEYNLQRKGKTPIQIVPISLDDIPTFRDECDVVINTAGKRSSGDRISLLDDNMAIAREVIAPKLEGYQGHFINVTNPVDVITYALMREAGLSRAKTMGANYVDTVRAEDKFREILEAKGIDAKAITLYAIGTHDENVVLVPKYAKVGTKPYKLSKEEGEEIVNHVRTYARRLIDGGLRTERGTSYSVVEMVKAIFEPGDSRVITAGVYHKIPSLSLFFAEFPQLEREGGLITGWPIIINSEGEIKKQNLVSGWDHRTFCESYRAMEKILGQYYPEFAKDEVRSVPEYSQAKLDAQIDEMVDQLEDGEKRNDLIPPGVPAPPGYIIREGILHKNPNSPIIVGQDYSREIIEEPQEEAIAS